ncbi:MAG: outer membrane beta-barrel protein [Bacteroidia bacterium]
MIKNLTIAALLLVSTTSFGQARDTEKEKAAVKGMTGGGRVVKEGTILINVDYGFPFWLGSLVSNVNSSSGGAAVTGVSVKNLNHICGKAEYMVTDKVSVGLEYTYAQVAFSYEDYANNGSSTVITYNDLIVKQRALINMGIHFGESDKFDPYMAFGVGYKGLSYRTSNPSLNDLRDAIDAYKAIPVAIRIGGGFRYFFTENIGVNAEVGIGGPLVQGGISVKF